MTQHVDYQDRKQAFLDTALALFNEKGYEKTTINDIIQSMGVSKGAFYHYFQSKEDVIEQISDNYAEQVLRQAGQVAAREDLTAVEKMNHLFQVVQGYKRQHRKRRSQIKQLFQSEQNLKLERKILNKLRQQMSVSLERIIEEGVETKQFRRVNPREMTAFLQFAIQGLNTSCDELANQAYASHPPDLALLEECLVEKLDFYEEAFALLFQVPPGTIQLKDAYLNRYLEP